MRTIGRLFVVAGVAALGLAPTAGTVSADSESHFVGTFTEDITPVGCLSGLSPADAKMANVPLEDPATWGPASGTWRVNAGTSTASSRFVIYLDTVPHVAFTMPLKVQTNDDGVLQATGMTGAGELTVTISGDDMTYSIADYDSTSFGSHAAYCPGGSVTYHGTVS